MYVENPIERLQSAIAIVEEDLNRMSEGSEEKSQYLKELDNFNRIIASNDLPEFYDPIESDQYRDNLDSYNFSSIFAFMTNPEKRAKFAIRYEGPDLLNKILLVWLARILSEKLLSEVILVVLQIDFGLKPIKEKELLTGRGEKLREISERFFQCFVAEGEEG